MGNIEYLSIQFDSTRVRDLTIMLKNDGWFEEKTDPIIKTNDISSVFRNGNNLIVNIHKINTTELKMISYTKMSEPIELEIRYNLINGKCQIIEGGRKYVFDTQKVE